MLTNLHQNLSKNQETQAGHVNDDTLLIKANYQFIQLKINDILFVKALADYVIITMINNVRYITLSTMKDMCDNLPAKKFARTHRSFIVNMDKIHLIKGSSLIISHNSFQYTIPIGRVYKKVLKAVLTN